MEDEPTIDKSNVPVSQFIYPEASAIFTHCPRPIKDVLDDCIIVLDTNALLVPYDTGKASIEQIGKIYKDLVAKKRLFVPGQVAREFANNRANKLAELYQKLSRARNVSISIEPSPLLDSLEQYKKVVQHSIKAQESLSEFRNAVSGLLDYIKSWHWNDPVSLLYKELFPQSVVIDPEFNLEQITTTAEERYSCNIPPGYKDRGKKDGGVGDLLIWYTILEIGKSNKSDLIFVSGDEKTDWQHRSENQSLYPRYELVDEYRRHSDNHSFYILSFAGFLDLFGVAQPIVDEVRETEKQYSNKALLKHRSKLAHSLEMAAFTWLQGNYPDKQVVKVPSIAPFDFLIVDPKDDLNKMAVGLHYFHIGRSTADLAHIVDQTETIMDAENLQAFIILIGTDDRDVAIGLTPMVAKMRHSENIAFLIGYITQAGNFNMVYFK